MKRYLLLILMFLCVQVHAQDQLLLVANEYLANKEYAKAAELFKKLHENSPTDVSITEKYYESLIGSKDVKNAEKLVKALIKSNKSEPRYQMMMVQIYTLDKEEKKAKKLLDQIVEDNCTNDGKVRAAASLFESYNLPEYSIKIYELARKKSEFPLAYAEELAVLYNKKGDFEMATGALLDLAVKDPNKMESVKTTLLRMFSSESQVDATRKKIIARINAEPEQVTYADILAWIYIQQKDYEEAFIQYKAIDQRLSEKGKRVLQFARTATKEQEYEVADAAYNYILSLGKQEQYYYMAYADKIASKRKKLLSMPTYDAAEVDSVLAAYEQYFADFANAKNTESLLEYTMLLARYANNAQKAIDELLPFVNNTSVSHILRGKGKLDLGDYYLIQNNHWEASLIYSQVDKTYKNDALGEEARFRNAKLSYYQHDYIWAQSQLDVLKASTSELIANDALNLSVLITENMPYDSVFAPLDLFANADLLLFQNKTREATACLDTIAGSYSDNKLVDDVLHMRGKIAFKQKKYEEALNYYTQVYTKYGDDVLADDAIFQSAIIQEKYLQNPQAAKDLYEKIILNYAGSTFVTEARKNFRRLRGDKLEDS